MRPSVPLRPGLDADRVLQSLPVSGYRDQYAADLLDGPGSRAPWCRHHPDDCRWPLVSATPTRATRWLVTTARRSISCPPHYVRHGTTDTSRGLGQLRFDWTVTKHFDHRSCDLVWTRDPVALYRCLGAGLPAIFETYRPDLATRTAYAPWKRACLGHAKLKGVILHSQLAADAFIGAAVPRNRRLVARNGFAPALFENPRSG